MQKRSQTPIQAKPRKASLIPVVAGILLVAGVTLSATYFWESEANNSDNQGVIQSHRSYSLNLRSGAAYKVNQPTELKFDIRDENNNVLKEFDTVHEKQMHLIVVRKDRTGFQHVHPVFNQSKGMFTQSNFIFPTDGEYRIFADFTAGNAQMGADGMKLPATPYQDVQVGDAGKYTPQALDADKMFSNADGFTAGIAFPQGGGSVNSFYAQTENTFAISITKDGQPYKNLEKYLGALGHMVAIGPNLEFVHAHALDEDTTKQTGLVLFSINFPEAGRYKLFLQTQAEGRVLTTDYTITAQSPPPEGTLPSQGTDMMDMDHGEH